MTLADQLKEMHEQGKISDEILFLYGISGDLPDRETYMQLSDRERQLLWMKRLEKRLGNNWMYRFARIPPLFRSLLWRECNINWSREGF